MMLRSAFEEITDQRTGLRVLFHDVSQDEDQKIRKRIDSIVRYFSLTELKLPAIYGLRHVVANLKSKDVMQRRLKEILTMTAFVRNGCPHCRDAKEFLRKYRSRYPAMSIVYREVTTDPNARNDMNALVSRYRRSAASLPVIHFCNGLSIGFDREATTGKRVLQKLDYWSWPTPDLCTTLSERIGVQVTRSVQQGAA
ncbi:MAG: hypothetical protein HOK71_02500 [Planctomycetaceae bacterium]|nr:hypothetical protein [Planctomycetaceae bacterium]